MQPVINALHVHRVDPIEIRRQRVHDIADVGDPRVIDQHVETFEGGKRRPHFLGMGNIRREHLRRAARRHNLRHGLGPRLGATFQHRDVRTLRGEPHGDRATNARATTGDERVFTGETLGDG